MSNPQYHPDTTTKEELFRWKAPATPTIRLYHGTDMASAEQIRSEGMKFIMGNFHDFARGRNSAIYFTSSRNRAARFGAERGSLLDEKGAVVSVVLARAAVKLYEFDDLGKWKDLIGHNRSKNRALRDQHQLVKDNDIIGGWISTTSAAYGYVPVAYPVNDTEWEFSWQYVVVSAAGIAALTDLTVEEI